MSNEFAEAGAVALRKRLYFNAKYVSIYKDLFEYQQKFSHDFYFDLLRVLEEENLGNSGSAPNAARCLTI